MLSKKSIVILIAVLLVTTASLSFESKAEPKFVLKYSIAAMPTVAHAQAVEVFVKEIEKLTEDSYLAKKDSKMR